MLDFELIEGTFSKIALEKNCKIWICEKVGKRFSCIARYGEEKYSESRVVFEDERYVVFCENLNDQQTEEQIIEVMKNARKRQNIQL